MFLLVVLEGTQQKIQTNDTQVDEIMNKKLAETLR